MYRPAAVPFGRAVDELAVRPPSHSWPGPAEHRPELRIVGSDWSGVSTSHPETSIPEGPLPDRGEPAARISTGHKSRLTSHRSDEPHWRRVNPRFLAPLAEGLPRSTSFLTREAINRGIGPASPLACLGHLPEAWPRPTVGPLPRTQAFRCGLPLLHPLLEAPELRLQPETEPSLKCKHFRLVPTR